MGIQASDTNLGLIPFGHSYGLGNLVVPLLRQGTAVVVGVPPLPHAIAAATAAHQVTVFPTVPAVLRALAEADLSAGLPPLRLVISAGAPLSPELAAAFEHRFGLRPRNFYGSTETGGIAYDRSGEATVSGRAIGRPLRGVRLIFAPGRRFVVTSAAVRGGGRFRPADRGELNARGELVLLGRTDRVLKIAGRRLDPAEVESALRALPGIRDAWVGLHPLRRDALAAVYVGEPAAEELGERLRTTLAAWKIPRKWVRLEALPLTARGKTDRAALERLLR